MEIGTKWLYFEEEIPQETIRSITYGSDYETRKKVRMYNFHKNPYCPVACLVARYFGQDRRMMSDGKDSYGDDIYYNRDVYEDDKIRIVSENHFSKISASIYVSLNGQWEIVYDCEIGTGASVRVERTGAWIGYLMEIGSKAIEAEFRIEEARKKAREKEIMLDREKTLKVRDARRAFEKKRFKPIDDSELFS